MNGRTGSERTEDDFGGAAYRFNSGDGRRIDDRNDLGSEFTVEATEEERSSTGCVLALCPPPLCRGTRSRRLDLDFDFFLKIISSNDCRIEEKLGRS